MCDKYIFYFYTCLRWGKAHLTGDERLYLFGSRSNVFAQLDLKWVSGFMVRCRVSYQGELKRCLSLSPLRIEPSSRLPYICTPGEITLEPLADEHLSALSCCDHEGLVSLRDMTRLPLGFSILAENENTVVLRHILRDAVVIVPKRRAGMTKGV